MAFPSNLDSDLGVGYTVEDGRVVSVGEITKGSVEAALHQSQNEDLSKETKDPSRVKKFFDFMALHVLIPWINAIVSVVNKIVLRVESAEETVATAAERAEDAAQDAQGSAENAAAAERAALAVQGMAERGEFTPVKGVDYFTPQDKQEFADELIGSFVQKSENAQVGCKGYEIAKVVNTTNRIVTFTKIYDWEVGDRIAFDFGKTYTYGFTIKDFAYASGGCSIYVNEPLPTPDTTETMYVWNLDKPNIGDVDFSVDAFAYGENVSATGKGAAAFNRDGKAEGNYSFVANRGNRAGYGASAFGKGTEALADHTFTSGQGTVAKSDYQRVGGKFNVEDTEGKYADIVGGGERDSKRKNIYTLDWEGRAHFAGGVVVGDGKKKLATEEYVDDLIGTSEPMLYPVNEDALMRLANIQVDITDSASTFLYFTDPHLCEDDNWKDEFDAYAKNIEETFKRSGASFIVCGGDWIGSGDTSQEACYKLAYANSRMKAITPNFYFVVGNNDTNQLPDQTIGNLVNNGGKNYYYFQHNGNTYFVFDTGSDQNHTELTDYDREQAQWFADTVLELFNNRNLRKVFVFAHIGWLYEIGDDLEDIYTLHPLIKEILDINNQTAYEYNAGYDGTGIKDWMGGVLCGVFTGHIHEEKDEDSDNENGEPVLIARTQLRSGGTPTFDIVVTHNSDIGYGGANIKIINFGNGSDKHYQGGDY